MKKIEGHSKKIKISILIFLAAIFLGILVPINANAETVYTDVKYKQEVEFADINAGIQVLLLKRILRVNGLRPEYNSG